MFFIFLFTKNENKYRHAFALVGLSHYTKVRHMLYIHFVYDKVNMNKIICFKSETIKFEIKNSEP